MENSNKIVPPHLNAEVYRTDTTGTSTVSYLDYINIHSDGSILVGSSELTGRYWNGGASVYHSRRDAKKIHCERKRCIPLVSGTADGCFVGTSDTVLLCEDSGAVSIYNSDDEKTSVWRLWNQVMTVAEHDDAALAVDCLDPGKDYITVGADGHAKVWDISEMICMRNYNNAHSMAIYCVSVRPKSITSFATGSLDQYLTMWDCNIDKPVLDLIKNDCSIRCLRWLDENKMLFGDEAGSIYLVDIRNPGIKNKVTEFPAPVHKLIVHPECQKVAVCCDNKIVSVCDIREDSQCTVIYHDRHMHSNYVRGMAWDVNDSKTLHTLGWDGQLKSHIITWD